MKKLLPSYCKINEEFQIRKNLNYHPIQKYYFNYILQLVL